MTVCGMVAGMSHLTTDLLLNEGDTLAEGRSLLLLRFAWVVIQRG